VNSCGYQRIVEVVTKNGEQIADQEALNDMLANINLLVKAKRKKAEERAGAKALTDKK